jgi:hypothetical protein
VRNDQVEVSTHQGLCQKIGPVGSQLTLETDRPALAAWRSRHRICLRNRRPGFESCHVIRFLGKLSNAVVFN